MEQGTGMGAVSKMPNGASSTFTVENSRAAAKPEGKFCPWTRNRQHPGLPMYSLPAGKVPEEGWVHHSEEETGGGGKFFPWLSWFWRSLGYELPFLGHFS